MRGLPGLSVVELGVKDSYGSGAFAPAAEGAGGRGENRPPVSLLMLTALDNSALSDSTDSFLGWSQGLLKEKAGTSNTKFHTLI